MAVWNPDDYHKHSSEQQKWARELIGKLALRGDERVLDIGCGDGKVTAEIAAAVPRGSVLGVDVSADMVEFARRSHSKEQHVNLAFDVADASRLPFDCEFDVVFSNAALHWIVDHRPVLAAIARGLKTGGRALLQMGGAGNAAEIIATLEEMLREPRWSKHFEGFEFPYGFYGPAEYRQWVAEAGLTPVRVDLIPKDMQHKGDEGLAAWVRTTWMPYTDRVPESQREQFIAAIVARYLAKRPADAQGTVHLKMVRLEVEAEKR